MKKPRSDSVAGFCLFLSVLYSTLGFGSIDYGTIVYHSYTHYQAQDGKLWTYDLKTGNLRSLHQVNEKVKHAINPHFSGDGRYLSFMGLRPGVYGEDWRKHSRVFVYSFPENKLTDVTEKTYVKGAFDEDPNFSPVSHTLVFKRSESEIWEYNLDTQNYGRVHIHLPGEKSMPAYSPDGKSLAFRMKSGGRADLYTIHLKSQVIQKVAGIKGVEHYYPRFLSEDHLVYIRWKEGTRTDQLYISDLTHRTHESLICNRKLTHDNSDPFLISNYWIGLSSRDMNQPYHVHLCNLLTGETRSIPSPDGVESLGGTYAPIELK